MPGAPPDPAAAPATADPARRLAGWSLEVTARDHKAIVACQAQLAPGSAVYIASTPRDSYHDTVAQAARLRAAGFVPVPHVAARRLASFTQASDFLARLSGEAAVTQALVIGGDLEPPAGAYGSSLDLLQTGLFQKHGLGRIGLACYPEEHRRIEAGLLTTALAAKLELAERSGLEVWLVSQFCFAAAPIVGLAQRLRAQGVRAPLTVGLAGPADLRTLWKYALYCGIGSSIQALGTRVDAVSDLMSRHSPEVLVADLAAALRRDPSLPIAGIHIFAFGGIAAAAGWAKARLGLLSRRS
jgi:methylenetetrahydrofolate reductase (NADH)